MIIFLPDTSGRGLLVVEAVEALRPGVGTSGAISSETAPTGRVSGRAWVVSFQARKIVRSTHWQKRRLSLERHGSQVTAPWCLQGP
jgi:hypothetical protein